MTPHVCPWWLGYWLINPLRYCIESPRKFLSEYLAPGMTVLDLGCGMGFFSLDAARLVSPGGRVICVDLQERMIRVLRRRARNAHLADLVNARVCTREDLAIADLAARVDLALALHVVHEVPDPQAFFVQVRNALKSGAVLLLAEPKGHVSAKDFLRTVTIAQAVGFGPSGQPRLSRSRAVLMVSS